MFPCKKRSQWDLTYICFGSIMANLLARDQKFLYIITRADMDIPTQDHFVHDQTFVGGLCQGFSFLMMGYKISFMGCL